MREVSLLKIQELILAAGFLVIPAVFSFAVYDPFTPVKWMSVYAIAALSALGLILERGPLLVPRERSYWLAQLALAATLATAFALHASGHHEGQLLDWLSFAICALVVFQLNPLSAFRSFDRTNLIGLALVVAYSLAQATGLDFLGTSTLDGFWASTFGFQNMTAEFIGIALVWMFHGVSDGKVSRARWALAIASVAVLWQLRCRSVYLGLAITFAVIAFEQLRTKRKWSAAASLALFICVSGAVLLFRPGALFTPPSLDLPKEQWDLHSTKVSNSKVRIVRWQNSLVGIFDHWGTGLGPGGFEFGYLPYCNAREKDIECREGLVPRSPHNLFLELFIEFGIPLALVTLAVLSFWLIRMLRMRGLIGRLNVFLWLFLLVNGFFAFPMENAFPFFAVAIATGLGLRTVSGEPRRLKEGARLAIGAVALLATLFLGGAYTYAKLAEAGSPDQYAPIAAACRSFPANWRNCITKGFLEERAGATEEAERTYREVLRSTPHNYPALRQLGELQLRLGKTGEGCENLGAYDRLFGGESTVRETLNTRCR